MIRALLAAVLALTLVLGWALWRSEGAKRAEDAATARATAAEARARALSEALIRDGVSDSFTALAVGRMDASAAETNERLRALEGKINARPPVPAVCPGPYADLLRESEAASSRIRASESRLRSLRVPEGGRAEAPWPG